MSKYDRGNEKYKPFSEYRQKDYITPRSLKQAYGYEPLLSTEQEEHQGDKLVGWLAVAVAGFLVGLFIFGGK